jgi:hypothetical protein
MVKRSVGRLALREQDVAQAEQEQLMRLGNVAADHDQSRSSRLTAVDKTSPNA